VKFKVDESLFEFLEFLTLKTSMQSRVLLTVTMNLHKQTSRKSIIVVDVKLESTIFR
jgi:hypothetical protein